MNPKLMEKAMLENMVEKTGKSVNNWIDMIKEKKFIENKEIVKFLKDQHLVGHFYAHLIAKKYFKENV